MAALLLDFSDTEGKIIQEKIMGEKKSSLPSVRTVIWP